MDNKQKCHYFISDINECESSPCKNGAICLNQIGSFDCRCAPGFTGDRCENGKVLMYMAVWLNERKAS